MTKHLRALKLAKEETPIIGLSLYFLGVIGDDFRARTSSTPSAKTEVRARLLLVGRTINGRSMDCSIDKGMHGIVVDPY
jgi:hypothetical protein